MGRRRSPQPITQAAAQGAFLGTRQLANILKRYDPNEVFLGG